MRSLVLVILLLLLSGCTAAGEKLVAGLPDAVEVPPPVEAPTLDPGRMDPAVRRQPDFAGDPGIVRGLPEHFAGDEGIISDGEPR